MTSPIAAVPGVRRLSGFLASLLLLGAFLSLAWAMQGDVESPASTRLAQNSAAAPPAQMFTLPGLDPQNPNAPNPNNQGTGARGPLLPPAPNGKTALPGGVLPPMPVPNLQGDPKLALLWQKGVQAQQANRLGEAAAAYRELLRAKPDAFPAHVNLGFVLLQQRDDKQAVWHLRRATSIAPRELQPRMALAQVLVQTKQPRAAFDQWTQIAMLAKTRSNNPLYVQATMTAGALAFEQLKDWPAAETWLRRANDALKGQDPRTLMSLAQVLSAQKKNAEAVQVLRGGVRQFPKILEIQSALAQSQWDAKDQAGAIATLKNLEKQIPAGQDNGQALSRVRVMLGRAFAQQKEYSQAVTTLQSALDALPKNSPASASTRAVLAQTFVAQAQRLEKDKKLQDAADAWQKAAQLFPKNPVAFLQRAQLFQKLDKDGDALREYRRALQLVPDEPNALLQAAQLEEKTGDAKQATADWQNLIKARPEYKPAYFGLMRLAAKQNQWSQQLQYMETRAARTPDQRAIYDAVLLVSEQAGKLKVARSWVESLSKKYPNARAPRAALRSFAPKPQSAPTPVPRSTPAPQPTPTAPSAPTAPVQPDGAAEPHTTPLAPKPTPTDPTASLAPETTPQPAAVSPDEEPALMRMQ
jgi:tetratricopeptide (TPR) repeat protein